MNRLISLQESAFSALDRQAPWLLPSLARLVFAGVLLIYFWNSALTKVGDGLLGLFRPSLGAYAQIFPRQMEAVGFDVSQLGTFHWAVVTAGTLAEFALPLLILIGLFTRLAAIGMIGFVIVQSLTDIVGHGADAATIGGWFDRPSDALILDQRALWVLLLLILVIRGAGPLSLDRLLSRQAVSG
ncbi:MAG: DoxX family protein [Paracoccaceae bacterium]